MLIHVIDFEGNQQCGIIEYGIATLNGGEIESVRTDLCRADAPINPKDILLHGIRNEMLEDRPSFTAHQQLFYDLRQSGVLAAHHAPVENMLLNHYWTVVPATCDSPEIPASGGSWGPWIDSRIVAQRCFRTEDYSLGALIKACGLEARLESVAASHCPDNRREPHCALYDAIASALLLIYMQRTFDLDVRALIRHSQSNRKSSREDFAQEELF